MSNLTFSPPGWGAGCPEGAEDQDCGRSLFLQAQVSNSSDPPASVVATRRSFNSPNQIRKRFRKRNDSLDAFFIYFKRFLVVSEAFHIDLGAFPKVSSSAFPVCL